MFAALNGCLDNVAVLLEHGANIAAENADGSTALALANEAEEDEIVALLQPLSRC